MREKISNMFVCYNVCGSYIQQCTHETSRKTYKCVTRSMWSHDKVARIVKKNYFTDYYGLVNSWEALPANH